MKLFDVYPLFNVSIVKGEGCQVWTIRAKPIWTFTAGTRSSPSATPIRIMSKS